MIISAEISLSEYLNKKLSAHGLPLNIKSYLIELLCSYLNSESFFEKNEDKYQEKTLSELYCKTQNAKSLQQKNQLFKSIGDFSLCLSGFFRESIKKKLVDLSYYQEFGQSAYYCVSQSYRDQPNIFKELSREFKPLSKVLFSIHKESVLQSQNKYLLRQNSDFKKNH